MVEQSSTVVANDAQVNNALKQSLSETPNFDIDPDTNTDGKYDSYFTCAICLTVVQDPKQCKLCESIHCSTCISEWTKKTKECPNCKADYQAAPQINRFVMNTLNAYNF